ncbi:hypothetical protein B0H13DRAFT_1991238 [Mycena leptocephala]|nr:hypothetical protein B0H13DRAFT_1991238 [Mycena leptocephala]
MPHGTSYTCSICLHTCKSRGGLTQHQKSRHRQFTPAAEGEDENTFTTQYHSHLNALPCDANGAFLPPFTGPPPAPPPHPTAKIQQHGSHLVTVQSSTSPIFISLRLRAQKSISTPPSTYGQHHFSSTEKVRHGKMLVSSTRQSTHSGWPSPVEDLYAPLFGPLPPGTPPKWMTQSYELCTRDVRQLLHNQLGTTAFKDHVNLVPYRQFNHSGRRVWSNLMSGDWAWKQADTIAEDHRHMAQPFVPVVAGSDKTTVSVATGHQEYHPVYVSPGVLTGPARRAHGNGSFPPLFCPSQDIPEICAQLYHACLARVFQPLKAAMTTPEIQVWLTAIVQNWCPKCDAPPDDLDREGARLRSQPRPNFGILWDDFGIRSDVMPFTSHFPRADIHELLACDLLHQDIRRPEFPGLRRFPDGRDFNQWTGDDSKALMKVISVFFSNHLTDDSAAFMDICYLLRHIFIQTGVRIDISLPRQHSLVHYPRFIRLFESKHIKAMLTTISRLDKMAASVVSTPHGMMVGTSSSYAAMVLAGYHRRLKRLGPVMRGLVVGREHQCALVHWLVPVGDAPDPDTGSDQRQPSLAIVPIDTMARAAHLIGILCEPLSDHHMYEFLK